MAILEKNNDFKVMVLPGPYRRFEPLILVAGLWLAGFSIWRLAMLAYDRAALPGYDFRYFWLAGKMWSEGLTPYGPGFAAAGARMIASGHIPEIWPYPPNLWLPSVALGQFEMLSAWRIWLGLQLMVIPAASWLLAVCLPVEKVERLFGGRVRITRLGFFCVHCLFVASLEATQLTIFVGQISLFIYFGAAILMSGVALARPGLTAGGLAIVLMKPQVGVVVAMSLILTGRWALRPVLWALMMSVLLIVPPMMVQPSVLFAWLRALADYDGASVANLASTMTGIRNLLWTGAAEDIGTVSAMGITLAVSLGVGVVLRLPAVESGQPESHARLDMMMAQLLVIQAFAPLHLYDLSLFGLAVLGAGEARWPGAIIAVVAVGFNVWPSEVYYWFRSWPADHVFTGSPYATTGAMLLLIGLVLRRRAVPGRGSYAARSTGAR